MTTRTPSAKVKFGGDPPPGRERRYDWEKIAQKLRSRPGEWALIFEQDKHSLVNAITLPNGIKALRRSKGFEARTTNNVLEPGQPRLCDLWMRYNPEKDEEQD